jgi:hypothetical protein
MIRVFDVMLIGWGVVISTLAWLDSNYGSMFFGLLGALCGAICLHGDRPR